VEKIGQKIVPLAEDVVYSEPTLLRGQPGSFTKYESISRLEAAEDYCSVHSQAHQLLIHHACLSDAAYQKYAEGLSEAETDTSMEIFAAYVFTGSVSTM
jgi:hypothetical protein